MEKLQQQVRKARGRLNFQTFMQVVTWSVFGWLVAAAVVLAIPKIWALELNVDRATFTWSVVGGAVALGLVSAGILTWVKRRNDLEAAIEIDHRFGLKERISSSLSLTPADLETEAGRALVSDAVRRVERLDVGDQFRVRSNWQAALPLVPALIVFILAVFVPDAVKKDDGTAQANPVAVQAQIKKAEEDLRKRIAERRKEAEENGLKEAEQLFNKLEHGLDGMHEKTEGDRKKAMVELNNLAKQIKDRQQLLKDSEEIKKQMNNLKDLNKGPADKLADALKDGNFEQAGDELNKLAEKMKNGELNEQEQQQLQKQMEQMQEKLQQLKDAHEQAQQDLKEQIEKAKQEGDLAKAGDLQQKLEQLQQQQPAMDKLQEMANQLGQAAQNMKEGNQQGAADQLAQMQQQLQEMQNMEDELEMLEDAMDQIADAKDAMNCKQCEGEGCQQCQGQGFGQGQGKKNGQPGMGMGEGQGQGARPEDENDTQSYDSQVRGKVGAGQAFVIGKTGGPNKAGDVREEIKQAIGSSSEGSADALTNERLPRKQRDHVKEYYDAFRQGGE